MMNLHAHTSYSDGENSLLSTVNYFNKLGFKTIGISDHVRRESKWLEIYLKEMNQIKNKLQLDLKICCESKVIDLKGNIDLENHYFDRFDYIFVAFHRFVIRNEVYISPSKVKQLGRFKKWIIKRKWIFAMKRILRLEDKFLIAHPFSILERSEIRMTKFERNYVLKQFLRSKKPIEINLRSGYDNDLINQFVDMGGKVIVSYDSHSNNDIKSNYKQFSELVKKYKEHLWRFEK